MQTAPLPLPEWPGLFPVPHVTARLKSCPEDFRVDEVARFEPSGEGPHLMLQVRKTAANTNWVAEKLAQASSCPVRDVGFAGMKDRQAVTTQWYSVPSEIKTEPDWRSWDISGVEILQARRHQRKLKRGSLKGNRFTIVLRDLEGDMDDLVARITTIGKRGLPNYVGPQRFGHHGANVRKGVNYLLKGGRLPRFKRSIYLSAVRSFLFNEVLARRVELGNWDRLTEGDVLLLDGSHSLIHFDAADSSLKTRCEAFDVHPTGPLPGEAHFEPAGKAAALENEILESYSGWVEALAHSGVKADRRSLRLKIADLEWDLREGQLELRFFLPAGAYATSFVRELVSSKA